MPRALAAAFATLVAVTAASCDFEQIVELDVPPYEPHLVVGGFPTPDSVLAVRVGQSVSVLDPSSEESRPIVLDAARVAIFDEAGVLLDSLRYERDDAYSFFGAHRSGSGFVPSPGQTYTLRISAPGLSDAEATTRIPVPVPFEVRYEGEIETPYEYERRVRLVVTLDDPVGEQAYALSVSSVLEVDGEPPRWLSHPFRSTDPVLKGGIEEIDTAVGIDFQSGDYFSVAYFRDRLFAGASREMELELSIFTYYAQEEDIDELTVELAVMDEDYVRYQQTLQTQRINNENPFAEPVRLHTNVRGGTGVFAGYATYQVTVPID